MEPSTESAVRLGLEAVQRGWIGPQILVAALDAWLRGPRSDSLPALLRDWGLLSTDQARILDDRADTPSGEIAATGSTALLVEPDPTAAEPTRTWASPPGPGDDITAPLPSSAVGDAPPSDAAATVLAPGRPERYRVVRLHAQGGLGAVYRAIDTQLQREVAIKEIRPVKASHPASQARFVREALLTGSLEHPGIVPVYSLDRHVDGQPFYAMRFIRGETLMDAIHRLHNDTASPVDAAERQRALRSVLIRFAEACNAIAFAHSHGVIHRDVKPGNILLGSFGETLVVDWGLAKRLDRTTPAAAADADTITELHFPHGVDASPEIDSELTRADVPLGTPSYMSPEQAAGRMADVGPASDIFSLGVTLYTILTGRNPFQSDDVYQTMARIQVGRFPRPRDLDTSIPLPLEAICLKAMALRPEDRYRTAQALVADLESWMADATVAAYPETRFERLARWSRHHRSWTQAGAAALLAVALVATVAAALVASARQRERREHAQVERLQTGLVLNRALTELRKGRPSEGLLWLAHGLKGLAPSQVDEAALFRTNLATWSAHAPTLDAFVLGPGTPRAAAADPGSGRLRVLYEFDDGDTNRFELSTHDASTLFSVGPGLRLDGPIAAYALAPDARAVAVADPLGTVRLHDLGAPVGAPRTFKLETPAGALAFWPDGRSLLAACEAVLVRINIASGDVIKIPRVRPEGEETAGRVLAAVVAPDGRHAAVGRDDGTIDFWDLAATPPSRHVEFWLDDAVTRLAFRPDGQALAAAGRSGFLRQ